MSRRSEKLRDLPLEDLKMHPEIITDLFSGDEDVSVLLQKRGDTIRFAASRTYSKEATSILEEARAEYEEKKRQGYSREDAIVDFEALQRELAIRTVPDTNVLQ